MRTGYTLQVFGCRFFTLSPHRFAARKSCRALARAASPTHASPFPRSPGRASSDCFRARSARA